MAAGRRSREEEEERKEDHLTVFPPAHLGCKLTLLEPPGALGNHLRVFLSLCSQLGPLLLQILICFQAMLGKHKWKNIIWEKSGILQKVTFLESALETDVPLKSICGQGLCWETNCYKGKSTELQHNGYKKKLRQEGEREEVGEGKEKKKKDWRRIYWVSCNDSCICKLVSKSEKGCIQLPSFPQMCCWTLTKPCRLLLSVDKEL